MTTGYSGTPLVQKLGIKAGCSMAAINAPANYTELIAPLPAGVSIATNVRPGLNLIHFFTNSRDELFDGIARWARSLRPDGVIWISWYKKAAKLPTEITEDTVREAALPLGLVDVKVCAVDERWSGLKLVIRKDNRL